MMILAGEVAGRYGRFTILPSLLEVSHNNPNFLPSGEERLPAGSNRSLRDASMQAPCSEMVVSIMPTVMPVSLNIYTRRPRRSVATVTVTHFQLKAHLRGQVPLLRQSNSKKQ